MRTTLPRLTSLRAVAALGVFAFHLGRWDVLQVPALGIGYVGVAFFFVLSGFVLAWSLPADGVHAGTFYWRRLARVYPLHLAALVAALIVPVTAERVSVTSALAGLVLLQSWWPSSQVAFGGNGVSWSLSCEAAFYLALPLLIAVLRGRHPRGRWCIASGWVLASGVVGAWLVAAAGETGALIAYVNPAMRFGEFLLGVVAALAVRDGWRLSTPLAAAMAAVGVLGMLLPLEFPLHNLPAISLFFAVVVLAAQADLSGRPSVLTGRAALYAGELSFAFYLVHELVILNLPRPSVPAALLVSAMLAVSVACAAVLHHVVEVPVRRAMLRAGPTGPQTGPPTSG